MNSKHSSKDHAPGIIAEGLGAELDGDVNE